MNMIEQYRDDVLNLTTQYLDKLIGEIYSTYGFNKMFVHNAYEGDGISVTQIAFSDDEEIFLDSRSLELFNELMDESYIIDVSEEDREGIACTFEMLMYNTYGFDWCITVQEVDSKDGVKYTVHVLDSNNLDF